MIRELLETIQKFYAKHDNVEESDWKPAGVMNQDTNYGFNNEYFPAETNFGAKFYSEPEKAYSEYYLTDPEYGFKDEYFPSKNGITFKDYLGPDIQSYPSKPNNYQTIKFDDYNYIRNSNSPIPENNDNYLVFGQILVQDNKIPDQIYGHSPFAYTKQVEEPKFEKPSNIYDVLTQNQHKNHKYPSIILDQDNIYHKNHKYLFQPLQTLAMTPKYKKVGPNLFKPFLRSEYKMFEPVPGQVLRPPVVPKFRPIQTKASSWTPFYVEQRPENDNIVLNTMEYFVRNNNRRSHEEKVNREQVLDSLDQAILGGNFAKPIGKFDKDSSGFESRALSEGHGKASRFGANGSIDFNNLAKDEGFKTSSTDNLSTESTDIGLINIPKNRTSTKVDVQKASETRSQEFNTLNKTKNNSIRNKQESSKVYNQEASNVSSTESTTNLAAIYKQADPKVNISFQAIDLEMNNLHTQKLLNYSQIADFDVKSAKTLDSNINKVSPIKLTLNKNTNTLKNISHSISGAIVSTDNEKRTFRPIGKYYYENNVLKFFKK